MFRLQVYRGFLAHVWKSEGAWEMLSGRETAVIQNYNPTNLRSLAVFCTYCAALGSTAL
jgi:hypothetical protein